MHPQRHLVDWQVLPCLDLLFSLEKDVIYALLGRAAAAAAQAEDPEDSEISDGSEVRHFKTEQNRVQGAGEEGEDANHL